MNLGWPQEILKTILHSKIILEIGLWELASLMLEIVKSYSALLCGQLFTVMHNLYKVQDNWNAQEPQRYLFSSNQINGKGSEAYQCFMLGLKHGIGCQLFYPPPIETISSKKEGVYALYSRASTPPINKACWHKQTCVSARYTLIFPGHCRYAKTGCNTLPRNAQCRPTDSQPLDVCTWVKIVTRSWGKSLILFYNPKRNVPG